ncbi:STAS/SEC14 domain-containing protein [Olleya namhaensis]|uniref:SpoIIAA-like n=1 Tax=Olleya namhaensis TaxID=1144750 RepID=A0A1I3MAK9_9FLAO|nr:STAS/SEC14 domain-containing protein [Olleya namhaensis]SFI94018.1 hypothetical protein SAMN05443431_10377 [Olleya namhaensis]
MKIVDSTLADQIKDVYISDYGNFYFLDDVIISELDEGITYTWEEAKKVIEAAKAFYGPTINVSYVSNRINKYSVKPSDWLKFYRGNNRLNAYAVVTKSENSWFNALMEKLFSNVEIERFDNLYEAIDWAKRLSSANLAS